MDLWIMYIPHKNVTKVKKKIKHMEFICRNFAYITNEKIAGGETLIASAHTNDLL